MMTIAVLGLSGLTLFLIGYYFGNQMGRTAYIRQYLATVRRQRR